MIERKEVIETIQFTPQSITIVSDAYKMEQMNNNYYEEANNNVIDKRTQIEKMKEIFNTEYIKLNIGGTIFSISLAVLSKYPNSIIYKDYNQNYSVLFYDREPELFEYVIEILRSQYLLYSHKSLDPRKLQQILNELSYYNFMPDLLEVVAYINKSFLFENIRWYVKEENQSSYKVISLHPYIFEYEINQCYSFIISNPIKTKEKISFQFVSESFNENFVYIGLINQMYSEKINNCICKMPKNTFCLFSNGTIGINGDKYDFPGLVNPRKTTVNEVEIDLSTESDKRITFTRRDIDNEDDDYARSFDIFGNEFYLIWGTCKGKGKCSININEIQNLISL